MITTIVAIAVGVALFLNKDLVVKKVVGTVNKVKEVIKIIKDKF